MPTPKRGGSDPAASGPREPRELEAEHGLCCRFGKCHGPKEFHRAGRSGMSVRVPGLSVSLSCGGQLDAGKVRAFLEELAVLTRNELDRPFSGLTGEHRMMALSPPADSSSGPHFHSRRGRLWHRSAV